MLEKGFTLIELLVVISIIIIIAGIVIVALGGTSNKAGIANGLKLSHSMLNGLGYYAMGIWDFEEGSGDSLGDRSGFQNDGTWFGSGVHWVDNEDVDQLGTSGNFDGSSDYVAINGLFYNQQGQIENVTVEAWVKTTISDNAALVDWDRSEYFSLGINFMGDQGDGKVSWDTTAETDSTHDMNSTLAVNDNNWHHIVATYDYNTGVKSIYIDGQEDVSEQAYGEGTKLGTGDTRYGFLGDGSEATSFDGTRNLYFFEGQMDGVRIYHETLNSAQIYKSYVEGLQKIKLVGR